MNNNNDYRYRLDSPKVTGRRQQKTTCPRCGRKRCFVRYVDTWHDCRYVDNTCGRCDHEQSCGYHYKPADLYNDQPWRNGDAAERNIPPGPPPQEKPLVPLNPQYLLKSHSPESTFWQWFTTDCARKAGFSRDDADRVFQDYAIGATRRGDVIFWQVDDQGRIRSGHIMQYNRQGHREGYQGWVHARLIEQKLLPSDFVLRQCFFGQHLLPLRPDATVCLVESEKTALILSAVHPAMLWLATCGSSGLTAEKLSVLRGRRLVVFPDSGCLGKWSQRLRQAQGISYTLSEQLEQYPPNTDLADLLLNDIA